MKAQYANIARHINIHLLCQPSIEKHWVKRKYEVPTASVRPRQHLGPLDLSSDLDGTGGGGGGRCIQMAYSFYGDLFPCSFDSKLFV